MSDMTTDQESPDVHVVLGIVPHLTYLIFVSKDGRSAVKKLIKAPIGQGGHGCPI